MITGPVRSVKLARKLRSEMSLPETILWRELRKRPGGFKFRRQHPASGFVLDFYCAAVRLAIEIDGSGHDSGAAVQADANRSHFLRSHGVATTRVPARVVLDNLEGVVKRIVEICEDRHAKLARDSDVPLHHASHGPPPRAGEDRE
ncbi:MAG: hypothetical protein B7Z08_04000 [Sphingomonadales bacterium 32-68-7]|nr:MAG: hypothetical protein B7Z33_13815 [Sphingomonadales bacterium 12-68-11]OYX09699.1 MAG: hypothetical protein B7Z08_04000 [Sphingomonadales bacterium 32-68-7]